MADHFDSGKFGSIVAFGPFTSANATTGAANIDMAIGQYNYAIMPCAGSVIGISGVVNASVTAGSVTIRAHEDSTEIAVTGYPAPVCSSAAQASYASVRPGAISFSAGDKLGLSFSGTTTLDPTNSLEVDGYLFVQLNAV